MNGIGEVPELHDVVGAPGGQDLSVGRQRGRVQCVGVRCDGPIDLLRVGGIGDVPDEHGLVLARRHHRPGVRGEGERDDAVAVGGDELGELSRLPWVGHVPEQDVLAGGRGEQTSVAGECHGRDVARVDAERRSQRHRLSGVGHVPQVDDVPAVVVGHRERAAIAGEGDGRRVGLGVTGWPRQRCTDARGGLRVAQRPRAGRCCRRGSRPWPGSKRSG